MMQGNAKERVHMNTAYLERQADPYSTQSRQGDNADVQKSSRRIVIYPKACHLYRGAAELVISP